jgi:hypothetical protein
MKKNLFNLFFLLFFIWKGNAQTNANYTGKLLSLSQDKVYLSFDKPYYTAGETLFFKAFLADATTHVPDTSTTVLHVDIIETATKRLLIQQKLKISGGQASGSFNTEGVKGQIFIHAYTQWMSNLPADYHFNKNIQVFETKDKQMSAVNNRDKGNKILDSTAVSKRISDSVDVFDPATSKTYRTVIKAAPKSKRVASLQFFPESGPLLVGFSNRIAFKATDEEGRGVAVSGTIRNTDGDSLASFKDTFLGMGRFNMVVKKEEKYIAYVYNPDCDCSVAMFTQLEPQTNTAALAVDQKDDTSEVRITVLLNYNATAMPNSFFVVIHQRGTVCYNSPIKVQDKNNARVVKLMIPKSVFPEEGIATVTLLDDKSKHLAERLFFIRNDKRQLNIQLTTEKAIYEKRERVTVNIDTKTSEGKPIAANVSFTVNNNEKIGSPQYAEDLRAYMLLRSDLRGYIEQPNFYFKDTTYATRIVLDNLLMTQGWRRFNWQERTDTVVFKAEAGLSFQGTVRNGKKPLVDASLFLILQKEGEENQSILVQTDKKGRFRVGDLDFMDSARLAVKVANSSRNYNLELNADNNTPSVSEPKIFVAEQPTGNLDIYLESSQAALLSEKLRFEKEITLQEFEIKAKKKDPLANDNRMSKVPPDRTLVIAEKSGGLVSTYLQVRGIKVVTFGASQAILTRMFKSDPSFEFPYAFVLDGVSEENAHLLTYMSIDEVERIDIVNFGNGGFVTQYGTQGCVHVLTKRMNINYWKTHKGDVPMLPLVGYTLQKQFYTPDYSISKPEYAEPDQRTTLFWSPIIKTDAKGKASVSFYTTDDAQNARILVEGIDGTGKIGVAKGGFKVN